MPAGKPCLECIGYHGTNASNKEKIAKNGYVFSGGRQWLGSGVYFFGDIIGVCDGLDEAKSWAIYVKGFRYWAIFRAEIITDNYLDLANSIKHKKVFDKIKDRMLKKHIKSGKCIKDFKEFSIFQYIEENMDFDLVRAHTDGGRAGYPSNFVRRLQLQICVRNVGCIKINKLIEEN